MHKNFTATENRCFINTDKSTVVSQEKKELLRNANLEKPQYQNKVYVSHIFQNKRYNKYAVEQKILKLMEENPDYLFISPIHAFDFLYTKTTYDEGIKMCLALLDTCDEMWILSDYKDSLGVCMEIEYCNKHKIPYTIIEM